MTGSTSNAHSIHPSLARTWPQPASSHPFVNRWSKKFSKTGNKPVQLLCIQQQEIFRRQGRRHRPHPQHIQNRSEPCGQGKKGSAFLRIELSKPCEERLSAHAKGTQQAESCIFGTFSCKHGAMSKHIP